MDMSKCANAVFILILVLGVCANNKQGDCLGIRDIGYTYPPGDIILEYGQPLNITCVIKNSVIETDGKDAIQDLHFVKNNNRSSLSRQLVDVIDSTSIRLYIERPDPGNDDNYSCFYKEKWVCMNSVIVGVKPQNVTDFSCVSRNCDNLTCTWTAPNNYVKTDYTLSFTLKSSRSSRTEVTNCPNITENGSKMSCVWTPLSTPPYRIAQPAFNFSLVMSNQFGNNTLYSYFNHFKYVIPNAPEKLNATATSPHSIRLFWQLPSSLKSFNAGVHHRIFYQCEYYPREWELGGLITNQTKNENITFELKNLKYAHDLCDIRVSMRSAKADPNDERAWSENATRTVRTISKIPDGPPETNVGSFLIQPIGSKRNIYVHWKQIKEESKNGQDFVYIVNVESLNLTNNTTKSYIKLYDIPANQEYKINIWSHNEVGDSLENSTVVIPARRLPEPQRFVRIAKKDSFELKWDPPKTIIENYTIFWCRSENDRYNCDGYLDWVTVSNTTSHYNLNLPSTVTHQIAISANGVNSSSGMLWAECTIIPSSTAGKLKSVWIKNVGSTFIEIEWKIDCSDRITSEQGFIITYCPIKNANTKCNESETKNVTILNKNQHFGRVDNLKPYRTYRLDVAVIINETSVSQSSEYMYNTTHEAAPSTPPLDIQITNITESSFTVKWNPPLERNGNLRFYQLYLNGIEHSRVEADKNNFTLDQLVSYGNYTISLKACTVDCSNASTPQTVTTKMGVPSKISRPIIVTSNNSLIIIGWNKPTDPRGKNDYYQLKFAYKSSGSNNTDDIYNVTSMNYNIGCDSKKTTYYVYVRAVNIIGTEHKYGPWSDPLQLSNCSSPSEFLYIIVAVLFVFVVVAVYFGFKKLYFYFNSMKDVQVKLPPGLQTVVDQQPWGSTKHSDDTDRLPNPDPDEELLLDKFPDSRVDAPGMASPHETTSMETVPHLTPNLTRKTSLRQRNKPISTTDTAKSPISPSNYSVLGVDPSKSGLDDDSSPSPSYVTVDEIVKISNPGYISYAAVSEAEEKNKFYVKAGMTKDLLVQDFLQCDVQKPFEEKSDHVKADTLSPQIGNQFSWDQPPLDRVHLNSGYVSVGDALPPKNVSDVSKGYVPNRQFDNTKSIKED